MGAAFATTAGAIWSAAAIVQVHLPSSRSGSHMQVASSDFFTTLRFCWLAGVSPPLLIPTKLYRQPSPCFTSKYTAPRHVMVPPSMSSFGVVTVTGYDLDPTLHM